MRRIALTVLFLVICGSCVSVSLSGRSTEHAKGVIYREPGAPFKSESRDDVDAAWKNRNNGDMISYITDCSDDSDPSLDTIVQGTLSGLNSMKIESSEAPMVQSREARRVTATGTVDGVQSKIDLLVYKRNRCIFILSYVGVASSFQDNHPQFERFIASFRAP